MKALRRTSALVSVFLPFFCLLCLPGISGSAEMTGPALQQPWSIQQTALQKPALATDGAAVFTDNTTLSDESPFVDDAANDSDEYAPGLILDEESPQVAVENVSFASGCRSSGCQQGCRQEPWRLFDDVCLLQRSGIEAGGWLAQGFTANFDRPPDRSNWPVGFNDRPNEYQMNQLWLYLEKPTDTGGCGVDVGGRVDLNFGTDSRYFTSYGLEDRWNGSTSDYELAMPQLYMEVAIDDLSLKLGHFWSNFGYEHAAAPRNFFYSHAMGFLSNTSKTFTGLLGTYALGDQLEFRGGFHRGWYNWEDENNDLGFVGGGTWTSRDRRTTFTADISSSKEGSTAHHTWDSIALVVTHRFSRRLQYAVEYLSFRDFGVHNSGLRTNYHSYPISQYLIYDINPCWAAAMRFEWWGEMDETRLGAQRTATPENDYSLTWGLNWKPSANLVVRPEVRWNWSSENLYIDSSRTHQVLAAFDAVLTY